MISSASHFEHFESSARRIPCGRPVVRPCRTDAYISFLQCGDSVLPQIVRGIAHLCASLCGPGAPLLCAGKEGGREHRGSPWFTAMSRGWCRPYSGWPRMASREVWAWRYVGKGRGASSCILDCALLQPIKLRRFPAPSCMCGGERGLAMHARLRAHRLGSRP